jgi:diguanylate cyclase (GGDEF)-like protein
MADKMVMPRADKYQLTAENNNNTATAQFGRTESDSFRHMSTYRAQDVYQLLDTFITEVRKKLPCDGVEYNEDTLGLYFMDGVLGHHRCDYKIRLGEQNLGDIGFFREERFQESEQVIIENLLAGLVRPLRNALQYQQALRFALRDDLTGLRNSSAYYDNISYEIERAKRYKIPFSLLLINLDNFMEINRQYGRDAGNSVLLEVARRLENQARNSDIIFRKGGDEFLVFLTNTDISVACTAAKRIKKAVMSAPCMFQNSEIRFTMSIGVVTVLPNDSAFKLVERADRALYQAKALGKDRIQAEPRVDPALQEQI